MTSTPRSARASLRKTIPSRIEDADSLCMKIKHFLQEAGVPELCFAIELMARECLNNAVVHGNVHAADKAVDLDLSVGRKWIRLRVTDEGAGFAWRRASQRQLTAATTSGRGIEICGIYAERIQFNRTGNSISLWIRKATSEERSSSNGIRP